MQAEIIPCNSCGCTGEGWNSVQGGDGWTGKDCLDCEGHGSFLKIEDEIFLWSPKSNTYRGKDGRFKSLENIEVMG